MPSTGISGFKNWHNGSALNGSEWSTRNTISCGATGYVGALRFSLPQSASSITVTATAYRRLASGTMRAEIRTSELTNPTPAAIGADVSFSAPAANSQVTFTFTGSDQGMDFIDKQDDAAFGFDYFIDNRFQTFFKFTFVFGSGNQCAHIQ